MVTRPAPLHATVQPTYTIDSKRMDPWSARFVCMALEASLSSTDGCHAVVDSQLHIHEAHKTLLERGVTRSGFVNSLPSGRAGQARPGPASRLRAYLSRTADCAGCTVRQAGLNMIHGHLNRRSTTKGRAVLHSQPGLQTLDSRPHTSRDRAQGP